MKIITYTVAVGTFLISFSFFTPSFFTGNDEVILQKDSSVTVTVAAVGDLMCHSTQYNYARIAPDSYDFKPVFREVKNYLESADIAVGNLETIISGNKNKYSGYPQFNTPVEFLEGLRYAGFDILTTANNHSMDGGKSGVIQTINLIKNHDLNPIGTFLSEQDRDSIRIFNIQGIKLAILAYTYGMNGIPLPVGSEYLVNLIDTLRISNDIRKARRDGSDIVLIFYHIGNEYESKPSAFQKEIINKTISFGADIIIASHPHVIQPIDFFTSNNSHIDRGLVAYSLGNFISNQQWRYSDAGIILKFSITKNLFTDLLHLSEIELIPTWVYKGSTTRGKEFIILPSSYAINRDTPYYLSPLEIKAMSESYFDTIGIFDDLFHEIDSSAIAMHSTLESSKISFQNF